MTDLRDNLGWLIGSVATAIGVAFSWLVSSEIFATLIAVLVGFLASYFLQTKTQKRAWKREYSVKIVETVYSSLFKQIKGIIRQLEEKGYYNLGFGEWRSMQEDHRYFMVDEKFRTKLDNFLARVEVFDSATSEVRRNILREIISEEIKRVFNVEALKQVSLEVKYKDKHRSFSTSPDLIGCLLSGTHPKDRALKGMAEVSDVQFEFRIPRKDGEVLNCQDLAKFDEFWLSCLGRMKEDETCMHVFEENKKLIVEAGILKGDLVKRIEEPWKI